MHASRIPVLTALFLALLLGAAPWRVCAHGDHGGIWVPSADSRAACGHDAPESGGGRARRSCTHAREHVSHGACGHRCPERRTTREAPAQEREQPCHCDDRPLVPGLLPVAVQLAAPMISGWAERALACHASSGASEVAPLRIEGCRVAHEEDPIVLLR